MRIELDDWQKDVLATKGNIALRSARQTGKSTVVSIKAAEYAIANPKKTVMIVASVERQAYLLFEKVQAYMHDHHRNAIMSGKNRPTKSLMRLKNGSRIYSLPTGLSGHGIRGYTVDLLICDEAAFIPQEVYDSIVPSMMITRGSIWLLSTPFGRQGYFYKAFQTDNFKHFHISAYDCPRKDEKFIEAQKKEMTKLTFQQEVLGEFVDELIQFFPSKLIEKCMQMTKEEAKKPIGANVDYFLGVDVARLGADQTVLCSIARNNRKTLQLFDLDLPDAARLTDTFRRIKMLDSIHHYRKIYIDDGGLGAGVLDPLLEDDQTRRKTIGINNASKSIDKDKRRKKLMKEDLYTNLLNLMEQGYISLFHDPEIRLSLKSVQYEYTDKGIKIFGKYTHIAEALIRAAWCVKDKSLNIWVR